MNTSSPLAISSECISHILLLHQELENKQKINKGTEDCLQKENEDQDIYNL